MTTAMDRLYLAGDAIGAALWVTAYLLMLRRGILDRAAGVPLLALAPAIAWELIYAVVWPTRALPPVVVPLWLIVDASLVWLYLRFGAGDRRPLRFALAFALALALELALIHDTADRDGVCSGFAVNVVMSLSFLALLDERGARGVLGQSVYVALAKLLGTALTMPHALALHGDRWSLRVFVAVTLIADTAYLALLARRSRKLGLDPLRRL